MRINLWEYASSDRQPTCNRSSFSSFPFVGGKRRSKASMAQEDTGKYPEPIPKNPTPNKTCGPSEAWTTSRQTFQIQSPKRRQQLQAMQQGRRNPQTQKVQRHASCRRKAKGMENENGDDKMPSFGGNRQAFAPGQAHSRTTTRIESRSQLAAKRRHQQPVKNNGTGSLTLTSLVGLSAVFCLAAKPSHPMGHHSSGAPGELPG